MKILNPTFGSDFECFLIDSDNNLKSGIGCIGGTKSRPLSIGNGCFKQEDNVLAEFNIPPVETIDDWYKKIKYCIDTVNDQIKNQGLRIQIRSSAVMSDKELNSDKAREFGCSMSFNAYEEGANMPKPEGDKTNLRTAGFHIHVGFIVDGTEFDMNVIHKFIKFMDLYLGIPSLLIDKDDRRRELYGKAGDFRLNTKTLDGNKFLIIPEYRVLGGNLLAIKTLIKWTFDQTVKAIEATNGNYPFPGDFLEDVINNNDTEEALRIANEYNISYPKVKVLDGKCYAISVKQKV